MQYNRGMNKLDHDIRARILHLLCEGMSIRALEASASEAVELASGLTPVGAAVDAPLTLHR